MEKIFRVIFSLFLVALLCTTTIVLAVLSVNPKKQADGDEIYDVLHPEVIKQGDNAEILTPDIHVNDNTGVELKPFVPEVLDDDPFISMGDEYDFSKQYDYTNAKLSSASGVFSFEEGTYTASTSSVLYVNNDNSTPFPYGTISADIMNNGGDTGVVFGLSSSKSYFWEGEGIEYYFVFISQGGTVYIGRAFDGGWTNFGEATIADYSPSKTYNLTVLYRVNKIICYLDGVNVLGVSVSEPLTGTGWGIRAGKTGATISNVVITSKATVE